MRRLTVHVDGAATRSCITTIDSIGTSEITAIETIGATAAGAKIQKTWLDLEVVQSGYCQSGQIMSASALLASNPHPTDADIDDAMSGNTYLRIREAIKEAANRPDRGATMIPDHLTRRGFLGQRLGSQLFCMITSTAMMPDPTARVDQLVC